MEAAIPIQIVDGVIDGKAGSYAAAGAVDVKLDILVRILRFKIQQLRNDQAGRCIIDFFRKHDNAIIEEPGKNIIRALAAARLLHDIGYEAHASASPLASSAGASSDFASSAGASSGFFSSSTRTTESAIRLIAFSFFSSPVI